MLYCTFLNVRIKIIVVIAQPESMDGPTYFLSASGSSGETKVRAKVIPLVPAKLTKLTEVDSLARHDGFGIRAGIPSS